MTFGFNWEEAAECPGTTGLLHDETPALNHATIRPFVWAVLLARGAVRSTEVLACVTPICSIEDLKSGFSDEVEDDRTRAEWLIDEILGDWTASGLVRYNEQKDLWVLTKGVNRRNLPTIIKAVAGVDGQLPFHLNLESWDG